jgi:hypothetical protein
MVSVTGESGDPNMAGVVGTNKVGGVGVWGEANPNGRAIVGVAETGAGVWGHTVSGRGVVGVSDTGVGVWGANKSGRAVVGALDADGTGVWGEVKTGTGVVGLTNEGDGPGVKGRSQSGDGVRGEGKNGIAGYGHHTGVYAKGPVNAGFFDGNVHVTGDITAGGDIILQNADCAEEFDVDSATSAEPGTVMVLTDDGSLRPCGEAFDPRVVGVVSGAGRYRPAIVLDRQESSGRRQPIALLGKVYCKVDATEAPVAVGDLLTTSGTPGHAMRAGDPLRAYGCVLGKALQPLHGRGLIPILVTLQ